MSAPPSNDKSWSPRTQKLVLGGFALIVTLGLLYWNYSTFGTGFWSADPSSPDCIRVQARVKEVHGNSGTSSHRTVETYFMTYEYEVAGQVFSNKEQITFNVFNRSRVDEPIEICYMKDHPDRAAVIGNDVKGENYFIVLLVDIAFVVAVVFIIRSEIRNRRKIA